MVRGLNVRRLLFQLQIFGGFVADGSLKGLDRGYVFSDFEGKSFPRTEYCLHRKGNARMVKKLAGAMWNQT